MMVGIKRIGMAALAFVLALQTSAGKDEVVILATGGTIAGAHANHSATVGYKSGAVGVGDLLKAVPEIADIAEIRARQVFQLGSESMTLERVFRLADAVREELAKPSVAGVVVTHGTDTMEESAYLLNLVVDTDKRLCSSVRCVPRPPTAPTGR